MAMSIWFALLERYDIRSTFDETITWIWLRYRYFFKASCVYFSRRKSDAMVKSALHLLHITLTTHETSRNNNIQLSSFACVHIQSACIIIIIMMTFRFNLLVLWLFDKKCALVNQLNAHLMWSALSMYSRLSLFRLPEVRPPRYTGHLAWHGMLAICLLHKTHPEVRPLAIPFTGQCWLSQTGFSM